MKKLLLILLLTSDAHAHASDLWLTASLTSIHSQSHDNAGAHFNTANYGLGIEYKNFHLGEYLNSYYKHSNYALYSYTPLEYKRIHAGLAVGAVTGYSALHGGGIAPAVTGLVKVEGERFGTNLIIIPPALKQGVWCLGVQAKMKF